MLRALLDLSRISNLPTVWTNVLAAWLLAEGTLSPWPAPLGWLLLGASLVYSAGMILNDAFDTAWDRQHRPERPIPSGRISLAAAWGIGLFALLGGAALMVLAGGASLLYTALLLAAILAYDAWHKPWTGSVIVMGACRTLLYLAAGSAVASHEPRAIAVFGGILGIYIVALTLIARAEARGQLGKANRFFAHACLLLPALWSLAFSEILQSEPPYHPRWPVITLCLVFVGWVLFSTRQLRKGGKHIGDAVGWLLAGIVLVDALAIAPIAPWVAIAFALAAPLLRLWQRWIAAT